MIVALVPAVVSGVVAWVSWRATRSMFAAPAFLRDNYRGHSLPTAVGVLVATSAATVFAAFELAFDPWRPWTSGPLAELTSLTYHGSDVLAIAVGFSFLGLVDDVGGVGQSGGFSGHLGALRAGRLTTGTLKLLGGPVVAIAVVGGDGVTTGRPDLLRAAAIVCLAANLGNLLDRAPGRATKCSLAAFALLAVVGATSGSERLAPVAVVVGAGAGLLVPDLREELMLGDAGANALGAALGYGAVLTLGGAAQWALLGVLVGLNLVSEVVSFSRVIDAVGALRWADRLGSPHRRGSR